MSSIKKRLNSNVLSVIVFCPQDKSFLLLFNKERGDYWIPYTEMDEKLSWKDNFQIFKEKLFDCEKDNCKLIKIYKIWTLKKELLHLIFQISVSKEVSANCKTETNLGIAGWYSCSEVATLRPLLRSLEILEIINIYKPYDVEGKKGVTGEALPLGFLTEIQRADLIINAKNCKVECYLDLLDSAGISETAQYDLYEEYLINTYPCIYMNCISFDCAMQQYDLCENIAQLFQAADLWKRNFLTFQDFLLLFAVMHPLTPHYGNLAEIRCQYIFRYYCENKDGKLSFVDFKNLITDIELKKNPEIKDKALEEQIECITNSLNFKSKSQMTFDEFYNLVLQNKIRDTSFLLRFKTDFCNSASISDISSSSQIIYPSEFLIPSRPCKYCVLHQPFDYSIALKSIILKQDESPFVLKDMKFFEDTMTKSVSEELQILSNTEYLKQESLDLEEKIDDLICALNYFSAEIHGIHFDRGESEIENKSAYSWGSTDLNKLAITFIIICEGVKRILGSEPRLLEIHPPVYVMGDLHGNFHDLKCLEKTLWRNGMALSPAKMLFLGDYVDRGINSVEVVMYLFVNKLQYPEKWFLIRGNHEIREIQKLFTFQRECNNTFGEATGMAVWKAVNEAFDVMPLAAIIDHKVFCCHGGIPPPWLCPVVSVINTIPNPLINCERQSPLAWNLMWNDPLRSRFSRNSGQQWELLINEGFVPNFQRGTAFCFSCSALEKFLLTNDLSHVIRAHEVVKAGFQIHQKGKLLTVFSSSNYCGNKNYAGTVLVADKLLQVCMIDTKRKNSGKCST